MILLWYGFHHLKQTLVARALQELRSAIAAAEAGARAARQAAAASDQAAEEQAEMGMRLRDALAQERDNTAAEVIRGRICSFSTN
jgi:hypothetical protein